MSKSTVESLEGKQSAKSPIYTFKIAVEEVETTGACTVPYDVSSPRYMCNDGSICMAHNHFAFNASRLLLELTRKLFTRRGL